MVSDTTQETKPKTTFTYADLMSVWSAGIAHGENSAAAFEWGSMQPNVELDVIEAFGDVINAGVAYENKATDAEIREIATQARKDWLEGYF